jgi:Thioesterase-like superfamily
MDDSGASEFDRATSVGVDGSTQIEPGWDIGGNANGGYLLALAARHLLQVSGRRHPLSVTGHFLRPGTSGPAQAVGSVVKAGRRLSTAFGALQRDDQPMVQVIGAFADTVGGEGPEHVSIGVPDLPPYAECVPRTRAQGMVEIPLMDRLAVRLHPDHTGFTRGEPTGTAEVAGWFAFADGRPVDTLALLLACDALPPAVFNLPIGPGWVPTIEYTVHVRGVPAPGPVRCVFRSSVVQGGLLEEDGEVWDSADRLVAMSRQLGMMPLG